MMTLFLVGAHEKRQHLPGGAQVGDRLTGAVVKQL